ncbi:MAG: DUF481 domain-containing protein [Zoogloea sp.]|nr:DUF481 domain-containing protein [Zoogloea sp.]
MKLRSYVLALPAMFAGGFAFADPPKLDGVWRGNLGAALTVATGNTRSENLNLQGNAVRATVMDKWLLNGQLVYGRAIRNDVAETTANLWRAGTRYDLNITPTVFSFGGLDFEHDQLKLLMLRSVVSAGLGRHLIQTPDNIWDVFGGLTYKLDRYNDPGVTIDDRLRSHYSTSELLFGEESNRKISETTSFRQRVAIFPNLQSAGDFRATLDAGLMVTVYESISLTVTLQDRYDSLAQAPVKRNDLMFFTGLNVRLGPK